jgi:predicted porin
MKRSLLALAVLGAFAASAQAQSSITIYGSFDAGVRNVDRSGNAFDVTTMGSTGTFNSNRLGFRGLEDLGGGLRARFNLETGFNTGTGALNNANNQLFERTASVGLGGAFGFIDLGRQYTNAFLTIAAYDPLSYKYPGIAFAVPATAGVRYNNDLKYTGTFGPVTARAEWAFGEAGGSNVTGAARGLSLSYAGGPFAAGAAYTRFTSGGTAAAPTVGGTGAAFAAPGAGIAPATAAAAAAPRGAPGRDTEHWTAGGAVKFGPARVSVGYADQQAEVGAASDLRDRWMWTGVNYALTPAIELTAAYYKQRRDGAGLASGDADLAIISATYAFSKRTNLYAGVDYRENDATFRSTAGAGASPRIRGISVGLNHLF